MKKAIIKSFLTAIVFGFLFTACNTSENKGDASSSLDEIK